MTYSIGNMFKFGKAVFALVFVAALLMIVSGDASAQGNGAEPLATPAVLGPQDLRLRERYRLGLHDRVEVEVNRHPEYSIKVDISEDGNIWLPRIDEPIQAVCKTERELANDIRTKYARLLRQPFVTVRATEQKSQSFSVMGAVDKPGAFFMNRRIRLAELVSYAGSPTKDAGPKIMVIRSRAGSVCHGEVLATANATVDPDSPDLLSYEFNREAVMKGKESIWMQPGDLVYVEPAKVAYIVGNVMKPTPVLLTKDITLSQAIAVAEGLKPATKKGKIRILRKKLDSGEREIIFADLGKIEKLEETDPVLQADDIVAVSEDPVKNIMSGLLKAVIGGASSLPYILRY